MMLLFPQNFVKRRLMVSYRETSIFCALKEVQARESVTRYKKEAVRGQEGEAPLLYVAWTSHNPSLPILILYQHYFVHCNSFANRSAPATLTILFSSTAGIFFVRHYSTLDVRSVGHGFS